MFGHQRITEIGEAIERAAGTVDLGEICARSLELSAYLDHLKVDQSARGLSLPI
jgi:hypothetical protein